MRAAILFFTVIGHIDIWIMFLVLSIIYITCPKFHWTIFQDVDYLIQGCENDNLAYSCKVSLWEIPAGIAASKIKFLLKIHLPTEMYFPKTFCWTKYRKKNRSWFERFRDLHISTSAVDAVYTRRSHLHSFDSRLRLTSLFEYLLDGVVINYCFEFKLL